MYGFGVRRLLRDRSRVRYVLMISGLLTVTAASARILLDHAVDGVAAFAAIAQDGKRAAASDKRKVGLLRRTEGEWIENLKSRDYWSGNLRSISGPAQPGGSSASADPKEDSEKKEKLAQSGLRSYCVRLCDGYFWPINQHATSDGLAQDSARCEASCGSPARLFVLRDGADGVENMADLSGQPYSKLPGAELYRTTYDARCTCRAQPWQLASIERHKQYAAEEVKRLETLPLAVRQAQTKTHLKAMPIVKPPVAPKGRGSGVFLISVVAPTAPAAATKPSVQGAASVTPGAAKPSLLQKVRTALFKPLTGKATVADAPRAESAANATIAKKAVMPEPAAVTSGKPIRIVAPKQQDTGADVPLPPQPLASAMVRVPQEAAVIPELPRARRDDGQLSSKVRATETHRDRGAAEGRERRPSGMMALGKRSRERSSAGKTPAKSQGGALRWRAAAFMGQ